MTYKSFTTSLTTVLTTALAFALTTALTIAMILTTAFTMCSCSVPTLSLPGTSAAGESESGVSESGSQETGASVSEIKAPRVPVSYTRGDLLDTIITITIYDDVDDDSAAPILIEVFDRIAKIEKAMSAALADSELAAIARGAGKSPVAVSDDTYRVIKEAYDISAESDGAFNLAVGPLVKLWGIHTESARVPEQTQIDEALRLIDYRDVVLSDDDNSVFLQREGMSLDLGAIAKGYAGDAAAAILKKHGIEHAILDLGGNIVAIGGKPNETDDRRGAGGGNAIGTGGDNANGTGGEADIALDDTADSGNVSGTGGDNANGTGGEADIALDDTADDGNASGIGDDNASGGNNTSNAPIGAEWKIGIRNPIIGEAGYIAILSIYDKSIVTSGVNERFYLNDGRFYHHIFDSKTGYPANSGLLSVTLVSDSSTEADKLSTALFVLGVKDGLNLLKSYDGDEVVFITDDLKIYATPGVVESLRLTDDRFSIVNG